MPTPAGRVRGFWLVSLAVVLAAACAHREGPVPAAARAAAAGADDYRCTQVIGVSVTGDWWNAGFEKGINGDRWQVLWRKQAFVELWADPASELWKLAPQSPCASGADAPDRVIFTAVNWTFTSGAEWTPALQKAVDTIKAKYPQVRRIELVTMLRGPGNQTCGNLKTVVQPYIDEAVATVVAASGPLVVAGPKVETSCEVFVKGGPHFSEAGMARVADLYRAALAGTALPAVAAH